MPPTNPPQWTLSSNLITGGSNGQLLVGCHVTENAAGTAYQFTQPAINQVLATSTGTSLPTGAFTFPSFNYNGVNGWVIGMTAPVAEGTNWSNCTWFTPQTPQQRIEDVPAQSGEFTAQAGGGVVPEEERAAAEKAASSGNKY